MDQYFETDKLLAGTEDLRRWQREALEVTIPSIMEAPILVEACPGAGKTHFGLEVAYRLLAEGRVSRVVVIVPTLAIADGWIRSASRTDRFAPTVPLVGPRSWRPVDQIAERWAGVVATYQSLFSASDMFLAHATDPGHRTLVIFDEVHHASVESGWGDRAQEAFSQHASAILCLTGTPFRTDRDPIVFVPAEGGVAKPHYRYGYEEAIRDGACRPVQFVHARGETIFKTEDGVTHEVSFEDDLTETGERQRLRTALEVITPGSIADILLTDANEYLLALRRLGDSDAAGLVVCVDCDHADKVAGFMEEHVLGRRPVVACSRLYDPGDPEPAEAIRSYRRSHDPWLVAVNMVSEGVDIRRLRAVVYLTNRLTLLSFRQIVGRVVRTDAGNVDDHGRVYIPADPNLLRMASVITEEVRLLPPPMVITADRQRARRVRREGGDVRTRDEFQAIASFGEQGGASDSYGREAGHELMRLATAYVRLRQLANTDPASLALAASENPQLLEALRQEVDGA